MRVVIAGSRAVPKGMAPRLLVRFLANLPQDAVVMLRRGRISPAGEFEKQTAMACELLGLVVEWCQPEALGTYPDADLRAHAREATFARDMDMVTRADLVLTFTTVDQIGDELSGTSSLVDKAMLEERPVYSYAIDGAKVERVGEHDPTSEFSELVPTPS